MAYDLGTAHGTIEIEYQGAKDVRAAARDMDKLKRESKDTDKSLLRLGATLKALGKGAAIGAMAVGMTNAAIGAADLALQIAGIVPQLTSVLSLGAALPGMFVGAVAAVGVLKAAFAGVGDAVEAAFDTEHPEKFDKALKKLSPSAQSFAKALRAAAPGLRDFQKGLQESFFRSSDLEGGLQKGIAALKQMSPNLQALASEMGSVAQQFTNFATSSASIDFVKRAIDSFKNSLSEASFGIQPLLTGLRDVGTVGLPLLDRLGQAVGGIATRFGEWLSQVAADGRLEQWINQGIATLKTLGGILSNVGGILKNVFQIAGDTGGGFLQVLEDITGHFKEFTSSAAGQEAITALFTGIGAAAKALAPVITTLVGALAGALGPALSRLATTLGPVLLDVVNALSPAFKPLADAFADVMIAIAPFLPPLAKLIGMLVKLGAGVISTIAANFAPLAELFGSTLTGAIEAFTPVMDEVIAMLPEFGALGIQLMQALLPLVPVILQLANAFVQELLPHLPELMQAALQLIPPLVQLATTLAGPLSEALLAILPYVPQLVAFLVRMQQVSLMLVSAIITLVQWGVNLGLALFNMGKAAGKAMLALTSAIGTGIGKAINFIRQLPGKAASALSSFGSTVSGIATRAWNAFKSATSSGIAAIVGFARALPGRVRGAIASLGGLIAGVARAAWSGFRNAVSNGINAAVSLARTLPGKIKGALSGFGSTLVGIGRDIIMGLVRGMQGAIGSAVSAAKSVAKSIIGGVKGALGISSPSKEMIKIGKYINDGLVKGLLGSADQVDKAAKKLADMVLDAYSDKLISKKRRNSILKTLSDGNKRLQALIKQANTISGKLKVAQENLADARKAYDDMFKSAMEKTQDTFKLVTSGQEFVNLDLTKQRFREAIDQAKQFQKDLATLIKRGLNKDLLQQIIEAGAQEGGAMAAALANADNNTIQELNKMAGEMTTVSKAIGKTSADAMYRAGVLAAEGIVKGLQSQQKAIENQIKKIADSLVKSIKKALKIKSPSRIMFDIGEMITQGLLDGMNSLANDVTKASEALATTSIIPTVQLNTQPATTGTTTVTGTGAVGGTVNNFSQTVNALPGMDAKQVADYSLTKMRLGLATGMSAAPLPTPLPAGA